MIIKCKDCKFEMVFRSLSKTEIILVCPNPNCDFQSSPIKKGSDYTSIDVNSEELTSKLPTTELNHDEESVKDDIQDENVIANTYRTQTILSRVGKINEFIIFCLDFSTRMDIDIPYDKNYLASWKYKILNDGVLSDQVKNKLIELLNPPISYFRAALFTFSNLILKNIKKMTVEDFQSFQIISLTGKAEELFRFPTFIENINSEIITDFINTLNITRQEYRSNNELEYRDYSSAIKTISELLIELRETYPQEEIKIYLLTIGPNTTKTNLYINPIREIKAKMEDLEPFSFNIINFNGISLDRSFQPITRRFSGQYSKECSLKGMINAILNNLYGTDSYIETKKIQDLETPKKLPEIPIPLEEPPKIEALQEEGTIRSSKVDEFEEPPKTEALQEESTISSSKVDEFEDYNLKDKIIDIDYNAIPMIKLQRKADNIIEKLKKQLE